MKIHSLRTNPDKPSVVKDMGLWWASVRHGDDITISHHPCQPEAFAEATRMAAQQ